jgi:hypothetical protein
MADCEKTSNCPFFSDQMANMPAVARLMKESYCRGDKTHCARYQVSSAGLSVPADLYPNDWTRAQQLIQRRPANAGA